jgi:hypothetical protein
MTKGVGLVGRRIHTYYVGINCILSSPPQVLAKILTALTTAADGGFVGQAPVRCVRFLRACNTASQFTQNSDREGNVLPLDAHIVIAPRFLTRPHNFFALFSVYAVLSASLFDRRVPSVVLLSPSLWILGPTWIEYGRSRKESQCTGGLPDTQDLSVTCKFGKSRHIKVGRMIVVTEVVVDS